MTDRSLDIQAALERWGRDFDLMTRLLQKFDRQLRQNIVQIREAVRIKDYEALANVAHSLKGAAAYVCAEETRSLAAHLEKCGRDRQQPDAECLAEFEQTMDRVVNRSQVALRELSNALPPRGNEPESRPWPR